MEIANTEQLMADALGYAGMTVRIYRATTGGPDSQNTYAMRTARGVITTAKTIDALAELARRERWIATYRHVNTDGKEVWVSIPD